jgi:hypothetical protein
MVLDHESEHPSRCPAMQSTAATLAFGLPLFALAFPCCNALVLAWRIQAEAAALAQSSRFQPVEVARSKI